MGSTNKPRNHFRKIAIVISLAAFFVYALHFLERKPTATEITFGQNIIYAQIADNEHKRSMGLSYTDKLADNAGMLFIFEETGAKNFWMRDMYFDIDIIWLDENKQVVGFFERVSRDSYNKNKPQNSKIYHSPDNTRYVLEVNSGTIEKLKIKVGDKLDFNY